MLAFSFLPDVTGRATGAAGTEERCPQTPQPASFAGRHVRSVPHHATRLPSCLRRWPDRAAGSPPRWPWGKAGKSLSRVDFSGADLGWMSGIGGIEGGQIREVKQLSSFYFWGAFFKADYSGGLITFKRKGPLWGRRRMNTEMRTIKWILVIHYLNVFCECTSRVSDVFMNGCLFRRETNFMHRYINGPVYIEIWTSKCSSS